MKQVYVIRHAKKDRNGNLTEEGKEHAKKLKENFPKFDIVLSSEMDRAKETAKLLTGEAPLVDKRANIINVPLSDEQKLFDLGKSHPYGIAGVIFETAEYRHLIEEVGENLSLLIGETLARLPENGKALIVSHDGPMVATERLMKKMTLDKAEKNYLPLTGYIVDENLQFQDISF